MVPAVCNGAEQGQTLRAPRSCTLSYPGRWWPVASVSPCRGAGPPQHLGVVLLPCSRCCHAAFPQCRVERYSPCITASLHVAQSSGVSRHLYILGHSSHSHSGSPLTQTQERETGDHTRGGCLPSTTRFLQKQSPYFCRSSLGATSWFLAVLHIPYINVNY